MTKHEYDRMENNVCYYAKALLGGYCVIKKTAETLPYGDVRARFKDGTHQERHYSFYELGQVVEPQDTF